MIPDKDREGKPIAQDRWTDEALGAFAALLHRFGREANRGGVGIVISGSYHAFTEVDAA